MAHGNISCMVTRACLASSSVARVDKVQHLCDVRSSVVRSILYVARTTHSCGVVQNMTGPQADPRSAARMRRARIPRLDCLWPSRTPVATST